MSTESAKISIADNQRNFRPGETIQGKISWKLENAPKGIEVNLIWYTEGQGTQDVELIEQMEIENKQTFGETAFKFNLLHSPYSFSGSLISLHWAIEFVSTKPHFVAREEFVMGPDGKEIILGKVHATTR